MTEKTENTTVSNVEKETESESSLSTETSDEDKEIEELAANIKEVKAEILKIQKAKAAEERKQEKQKYLEELKTLKEQVSLMSKNATETQAQFEESKLDGVMNATSHTTTAGSMNLDLNNKDTQEHLTAIVEQFMKANTTN